jgi:tetratricopeptide (TPR) repeat protein
MSEKEIVKLYRPCVLKIEESSACAVIWLGHLNNDYKKYKESLFYLGKMLEIAFNNAGIYFLTSIRNCRLKIKTFCEDVYKDLKEFDMERKSYERVFNTEFIIYAVLDIALIFKVQGKNDEAISSLKKIYQQDNRSYCIYAELFRFYLKNGENVKADDILEDFEKPEINNLTLKRSVLNPFSTNKITEIPEKLKIKWN